MKSYPRIYFACRTRHVRDQQAGRTISAHQASILDHLDELEGTSLWSATDMSPGSATPRMAGVSACV
jgi:hypothetical protein